MRKGGLEVQDVSTDVCFSFVSCVNTCLYIVMAPSHAMARAGAVVWCMYVKRGCHTAFAGTDAFNVELSRWDTSRVNNMDGTFQAAQAFNEDISTWDVSKVGSLRNAFRLGKFSLNLSTWDVSRVTVLESGNRLGKRVVAAREVFGKWVWEKLEA